MEAEQTEFNELANSFIIGHLVIRDPESDYTYVNKRTTQPKEVHDESKRNN